LLSNVREALRTAGMPGSGTETSLSAIGRLRYRVRQALNVCFRRHLPFGLSLWNGRKVPSLINPTTIGAR
jgi:hypothetical protein